MFPEEASGAQDLGFCSAPNLLYLEGMQRDQARVDERSRKMILGFKFSWNLAMWVTSVEVVLGQCVAKVLLFQMLSEGMSIYTDQEACVWMQQVAEGLHYLHTAIPKVLSNLGVLQSKQLPSAKYASIDYFPNMLHLLAMTGANCTPVGAAPGFKAGKYFVER